MARATYHIELDVRRDDTFDAPLADLTPYWVAVGTPLIARDGFLEAFDAATGTPNVIAPAATMTFSLDNLDGRFTPWDTNALYYDILVRGTTIRLRATFDGVTYPLWTGKVWSVTPSVGVYGSRIVTVECQDQSPYLIDATYAPRLQQNVTVDAAIRDVFETSPVAIWRPVKRYFMVGRSRLGEAAIYGLPPLNFETARTTLAYAGAALDNPNGVQALSYIRELMEAEVYGRFYWDARMAQWTLHNRLHDTQTERTGTFTDDDFEPELVDLRVNDNLINDLEVWWVKKRAGTPKSVVWTNRNVLFSVSPRDVKETSARFVDADNPNARISVIDGVQPEPFVDFTATEDDSDPSSTARTRTFAVTAEYRGDRAIVRYANTSSAGTNWINFSQLRGTPLYTYDRQSVRASNGASMQAFDVVRRSIQRPAIDDEDYAQAVATSMVNRFSEPLSRYASVGWIANKTMERMTRALGSAVGQRVGISLAALDGDYIVIGVGHTITPGGDDTHVTKWYLLPQQRATYWRLGDPTLGVIGRTARVAL